MTIGSDELVLFIVNDGNLYRRQHLPIIQNMTRKKAAGTYDQARAVEGFMYLVESGAKEYAKGYDRPWHELFSKTDRKQAAEALTKSFEDEHALGNYDEYIPKKYRRK